MRSNLTVLLIAFLLALPVTGCPSNTRVDDDDATSDDDDATGDDDDATGDDDDATGDDDDATGDDDDATGDDDDATGDDDDSATGDDDDATGDDDDATGDDDDATGDDDDATGDDDDATGDDDDSATGDDDDATGDDDDSATGDDDDSATGDDDDSATGDDDDSATGDDDDATGDDDDSATGDDDDSATGDDDDSATGDDDDATGDDDDSATGDDDDATGDDDDATGDDDDSAIGDDDDSAGPALQCEPLTTFVSPTGSFDDGSGPGVDYENSLVCGWLIDLDSTAYQSVTLSFLSFALENTYDYLDVYDGADATAPLLAALTGSSLPADITSSTSQLYVEFSSDSIISDEGFEASWTGNGFAPCSGDVEQTGAAGAFTDGSGPADYTNNALCGWVLNGAGADSIDLSFSAFDTESFYDFVTIYDGIDSNAPVLGTFDGSSLPPLVSSTGNFMYVEFDSDNSVTAGGFEAAWTANYVACSGPQTLTAASGVVTDGSGPNADYANSQSCSWLIDVPGAEALALSFESFNTEDGFDEVTVYDGVDATAPVVATYSGSSTPIDLVIAATFGPLYVEFSSDGSVTAPGFVASYTAIGVTGECSGNELLTSTFGVISDGAGDYANNSTCSWTIDVPEASAIDLEFGVLETEATYDFVDIFDGPDAFSPLLASYDGAPLVPTIVSSTGNSMFVDLDTDGSVTDTGLTAIYEAVFVPCAGPSTLTNTTGGLGDGSGPNDDYSSSQSCSWLIDAPVGSLIDLTAEFYDLETGYDYVDIYDGVDATAPSLGSLNGVGAGTVFSSTGNQLFVEFSSDGSVTYDGFWMTYVVY